MSTRTKSENHSNRRLTAGKLMMDLAHTDDAELHNALRLLIMEWCVRYAIPRSDLQESLDDLLGGERVPWPVELQEGPQGELLEKLTDAGLAYAIFSGRTWRNYEPHNDRERGLLRWWQEGRTLPLIARE